MRHTRALVTAVAIAGLLVGSVAFARGRMGAQHGAGLAQREQAFAFGGFGAGAGLQAPLLAHLPIGTAVDVTLFAGDPDDGAAALTTLSIVVGESSEAAFAQALAAAAEDAAYARYEIGATTRTIALDGVEATARGWRLDPVGPALGLGLATMADGDTVTVSFFADDPAGGGAPTATIDFAYGVDSALAFTRDVHAAAIDAAYASIVTGPRSITVDLGQAPVRFGAAPFAGRMMAAGPRGAWTQQMTIMPGWGGPRR